jgi:TldD protein
LKDLIMRALNKAQMHGAQYADVRVVNRREESIAVKDGIVEELNSSDTEGIGVRVLVNGAWGFASSRNLTNAEVDQITANALDIAHASALVSGEKVDLGPKVTNQGTYQTPMEIDPFTVPLEDKLAVLIKADGEMGKVQGVRTRRSHTALLKEHKQFGNTEGAFTEQTLVETGGGIQATAVGGSEIQMRSYPNAFARQQVTCQVMPSGLPMRQLPC